MAALSLSVTEPSGVVVTYWRVSKMHIDAINQNINSEVGGWLSESSWASGDTPVTVLLEMMGPAQFAAILASTNVILEFYTILMTMPDFNGSTLTT